MSSDAAQPPPPTVGTASAAPQTFVSLDGGFKIDLPASVSGVSGIKPDVGFSTGGTLYSWRLPDGRKYQIGFVDRILKADERLRLLETLADSLIAEHAKSGQTLVHRRNFKFQDHAGIEVRMTIDGGTAQTRYILAGSRLFILNTGWPLGKLSDSYVKPLDSFELVNAKEIIAKRLQEATPPELPQSPRPSRAKSDAGIENLVGKVKVVSHSKEYIEGGSTGGLVRSGDSIYDGSGYLVKTIYFDYRGNPGSVTVFGFIDGKRVSKSGKSLDYEYNPPPMAAPPPPKGSASGSPPSTEAPPKKTSDSRYGSQYDLKFDTSNRLIERTTFDNREEMVSRVSYGRDGNTVEEIGYSRNGEIRARSVSVLDDRGNVVQETNFSTSAAYPENGNRTYKYLTFDEKGNWTKREVVGTTARYNGGLNRFHFIEYREISYH